jgi:hypothetical protein
MYSIWTPRYDSASPSFKKLFSSGRRFKAHPLQDTIFPVMTWAKTAQGRLTTRRRKNIILVFGIRKMSNRPKCSKYMYVQYVLQSLHTTPGTPSTRVDYECCGRIMQQFVHMYGLVHHVHTWRRSPFQNYLAFQPAQSRWKI